MHSGPNVFGHSFAPALPGAGYIPDRPLSSVIFTTWDTTLSTLSRRCPLLISVIVHFTQHTPPLRLPMLQHYSYTTASLALLAHTALTICTWVAVPALRHLWAMSLLSSHTPQVHDSSQVLTRYTTPLRPSTWRRDTLEPAQVHALTGPMTNVQSCGQLATLAVTGVPMITRFFHTSHGTPPSSASHA